jgi:hypothetical protein
MVRIRHALYSVDANAIGIARVKILRKTINRGLNQNCICGQMFYRSGVASHSHFVWPGANSGALIPTYAERFWNSVYEHIEINATVNRNAIICGIKAIAKRLVSCLLSVT